MLAYFSYFKTHSCEECSYTDVCIRKMKCSCSSLPGYDLCPFYLQIIQIQLCFNRFVLSAPDPDSLPPFICKGSPQSFLSCFLVERMVQFCLMW